MHLQFMEPKFPPYTVEQAPINGLIDRAHDLGELLAMANDIRYSISEDETSCTLHIEGYALTKDQLLTLHQYALANVAYIQIDIDNRMPKPLIVIKHQSRKLN